MQLSKKKRTQRKVLTNRTLAIKAARLNQKMSRRDLAARCNVTVKSIEKIENGRDHVSDERLVRLIEALGISRQRFKHFEETPRLFLAQFEGKKDRTLERRPRRNQYKVVTKEVRVVRIPRPRKCISKRTASKLCGLSKAALSHTENGRTDLKRDRVEHILKCLGYEWNEFEILMNAEVLRDEAKKELDLHLSQLSDQSFLVVQSMVKALAKQGGN